MTRSAELLDEAEDIINAVGPEIVAEVEEEERREQRSERRWWRRRR